MGGRQEPPALQSRMITVMNERLAVPFVAGSCVGVQEVD